MRPHPLLLALALFCGNSFPNGTHAADAEAILLVLQRRSCRECMLQDADLVHADLRDADLSGAQLQRANLGQARLDGADLSGANLNFTSLRGASLRGANLQGAKLYGTDLRESDLSGVLLSPGALEEAHWSQATGIPTGIQSYAALHNAGVDAALNARWPSAEKLFSEALLSNPRELRTWIARGITRSELAKDELAASDFRYAAMLYQERGEALAATQLLKAAKELSERKSKTNKSPSGNGWGGQLLNGLSSMAQALAPLALKAFVPLGLGF